MSGSRTACCIACREGMSPEYGMTAPPKVKRFEEGACREARLASTLGTTKSTAIQSLNLTGRRGRSGSATR
jgi:hypothetical protein